jgi:citrate synthase
MLIMVNVMDWLTTSQAARRLGVKPATIYAYVSRGLLTSHRDADHRTSRFPSDEVEVLARRGRPREASRHHSLDIAIETRITEIAGHTIRFRGHDAFELARAASFEQVAELLWTGVLPPAGSTWPTRAIEIEIATFAGLPLRDQLRLVTAHAAVGSRERRDPRTVSDEGRRLIAALVDSLPVAGDGRCPRLTLPDGTVLRGSLAGRLWSHLSPRRATPELVATLNATMVLLADHEMAAGTLAARVAASTRAGVHGVVAAGMGALTGPLHGGESQRCRRVLAGRGHFSAGPAVAMALEMYGRVPGFGQVLYPQGDPRAVVLLGMLREAAGDHPGMVAVEQLIAAAARRRLPPPNVDLALAALGLVADMPQDAGEAIFATARIAGWLAHALEEYGERPLRFRPRAVYIGDGPGGSGDGQ